MPTKRKTVPREWTSADVRAMKRAARLGLSAREAGKILRRTRGAVAFKAMRLGVRFHAIEQPRGAQMRALKTRRARGR